MTEPCRSSTYRDGHPYPHPAVAERLFREIGYQKTTVADIAKVLKMSPANVYRFFDSKKAIHQGVARG